MINKEVWIARKCWNDVSGHGLGMSVSLERHPTQSVFRRPLRRNTPYEISATRRIDSAGHLLFCVFSRESRFDVPLVALCFHGHSAICSGWHQAILSFEASPSPSSIIDIDLKQQHSILEARLQSIDLRP